VPTEAELWRRGGIRIWGERGLRSVKFDHKNESPVRDAWPSRSGIQSKTPGNRLFVTQWDAGVEGGGVGRKGEDLVDNQKLGRRASQRLFYPF